jgi:hypothetical protein
MKLTPRFPCNSPICSVAGKPMSQLEMKLTPRFPCNSPICSVAGKPRNRLEMKLTPQFPCYRTDWTVTEFRYVHRMLWSLPVFTE